MGDIIMCLATFKVDVLEVTEKFISVQITDDKYGSKTPYIVWKSNNFKTYDLLYTEWRRLGEPTEIPYTSEHTLPGKVHVMTDIQYPKR